MKTIITLLVSFFVAITATQAQWVPQTVPANVDLVRYIDIVDPNVIWAYHLDVAPNILRTTNGGGTWSTVTVNIPNAAGKTFDIFSLEAIDANTAYIAGALGGSVGPRLAQVYKTTDAGITWTLIPGIYTSQNSYVNFVQFFDASNGVIVGDLQEIYTTNDGGNTWTIVPQANLPAPTAEDYTLERRVVLGDTIWVTAGGMRIYKSIDKGLHWTASSTNIVANTPGFGPIPVGLAFQDGNIGLVNHGNNLSRTTDGGQTWTPVTYSGPFFNYGITHVTGTPQTYVSFTPVNTNPGISITHDGGLTWSLMDNNAHSSAAFINSQTGWSGGIGTMYKLAANISGTTKELSSANNFVIYPNPSQGLFTIIPASAKSFNLEVYDLAGKRVMQQEGNRFGKNALDLSGQKKGIYLLHILSGEQQIIEKIVLQ
ncbi:T9SS type A sorting domain-containing protein [Adhaeribacter terreus]|uniref:T9SS type A sorting domain-containing protein n=1 Tax=Adhaeribacter terreus TaxID=529703 RepID=A0ABW0E9D2_9BACT